MILFVPEFNEDQNDKVSSFIFSWQYQLSRWLRMKGFLMRHQKRQRRSWKFLEKILPFMGILIACWKWICSSIEISSNRSDCYSKFKSTRISMKNRKQRRIRWSMMLLVSKASRITSTTTFSNQSEVKMAEWLFFCISSSSYIRTRSWTMFWP